MRRRRGGGGLDAWPGYVDALSTLLMVIIFVLLVFVLAQGFLSVALSSRDRALDRLNRQVSELSELLSLERGQAEELRGALGRATEELRAQAAARAALVANLGLLREDRDRIASERDQTRAERDRLAARIADLELSAGGGAARIAELESRVGEARARAEAAGGDAANTVRTLTDAQRLLQAERAALEAVRRDLGAARDQASALGRDLTQERSTRQATARELVEEREDRAALQRELSMAQNQIGALSRGIGYERDAREQTERELAQAREQGQALARDLATTRAARDQTAQALETRRQEAEALARDLATTRTARDQTAEALEARRREAEALARDLAAARVSLEAARRDIAALMEQARQLDRTVQADRATIEARLSDMARLAEQIRGLEALRDQLERQAEAALARAGEEERRRGAAEGAVANAQRLLAEAMGRAEDSQRVAQQATQRATAAQGAAEQAARARADAERISAEAQRSSAEAQRANAEAQRTSAEAQRANAEAQRTTVEAQRASAAAALLASDAGRRAQEEERRRVAAESQASEYARLSESARVQVAQLTRQLEALRAELSRVAAALDAAEASGRDKEAQIVALGQRLNVALAARVEELQQYRSDFFGRLRRVLGDRPEVRIVGDRFVFQSEVLFPVGSAELSPGGQAQLRDLARVLIDLAGQFPADLSWVLRVDGHADRSPIRGGGRFATNWELSASRSIAVAQLLMAEGLPPNRVAAAAFGDTQPLDDRDTPDAFARNRRIELRLEAGPSNQAPAAPAPSPSPGPRSLGDAIRGLGCARVAEVPGGALLAGVGQRGTGLRLRSSLPSGIAAPRLALVEFVGPYCGVLDALKPVEPSAAPGALRVAPAVGGPVRVGEPLVFDVTMPDWPAQLSLIHLASDGAVVVLETLPRQAPGARIRLGAPRPGFPGWIADAPLGTDLILAIASEAPLPQPPRAGRVEDLAAALAGSLAQPGGRVAAEALVVTVVR